jgi:hypothetical protein
MFEFNALLFPDLITMSLGHWDIVLEPGRSSVQIVNMMPFFVIPMGKIMYSTTKQCVNIPDSLFVCRECSYITF